MFKNEVIDRYTGMHCIMQNLTKNVQVSISKHNIKSERFQVLMKILHLFIPQFFLGLTKP